MKQYYSFILLVYLSTFCLFSHSEDNPALSELNELLSLMNTLQADFAQTIKDDQNEVLQKSSGSVALKRPQQFFWRTIEPYEHVLVTTNNTLWLHDIDLEQVTRQTLTEDLQQAPALLLSGDIKKIKQQFIVEYGKNSSDKNRIFDLMPKNSGGTFSQLSLAFNDRKLTSMSFLDSFAQVTTIEFSNAKMNISIDPKLFIFIPPENIDIINNDLTGTP